MKRKVYKKPKTFVFLPEINNTLLAGSVTSGIIDGNTGDNTSDNTGGNNNNNGNPNGKGEDFLGGWN